MSSKYLNVLESIKNNDQQNFSKNIIFITKMKKGITKECIKFQRWEMLEEWSNYNLKIKKPFR